MNFFKDGFYAMLQKNIVKLFYIPLLCFLFFSSCDNSNSKVYYIGMDLNFFPLQLESKKANLFAFSNEIP